MLLCNHSWYLLNIGPAAKDQREMQMAYRVFLSSTFTDLIDYRKSVRDAIRQFGALDVSMEHFGARDERPADECMRLVKEESDLFVGIYAHRYGFIPDGSDVSVSELEYRAASEVRLPRFIYIIDNTHPWVPAHIDGGSKGEKLTTFKESLYKKHICQPFTSKDQLATRVVADIGRHAAMQRTPKVGPGIPVDNIGLESLGPVSETIGEWGIRRKNIYDNNRGIFLAHVAHPSTKPGQEFDIYIYLVRHKSEDLKDVRVAEFFLGPYWENKIFPAVERDGFIGISTSAYGSFLCICRVTFDDGSDIVIDRYIDFEMLRNG
jgi:uncharacterized protein DUF4062/pYEATS domain-containing protein involved in immunity